MEVMIAFCTILIEGCRYNGGKSICSFWEPGVVFQTMAECNDDKKLIEDYVVEELWKIYPKAVKIYAKGLCYENKKSKEGQGGKNVD